MRKSLEKDLPRHQRLRASVGRGVAAALVSALAPAASAMEIDIGNPDVKVRWDNTLKYTAAWRVKDPDQNVAASFANPNVDAGDLSLDKGLINNRVDWLTEFDVSTASGGLRISAAAWYDQIYNRDTNDFPSSITTPNTVSAVRGGPNNRFTGSTKHLMGQYAEISDAFIWGGAEVGNGMKLSGRLGRHTQLYGETLFLGANGIAAAQGPVDLIKAFSLPGAQFKEIALPVGQLSGNLQINANVSVGGYYQYEWRPLRLPATGSYYSPADLVGDGADLIISPLGFANRVADQKGDDSGQFGAKVKFKIPGSDVEFGLYAAKYHDKAPIAVYNPADPSGAFGAGTYRLVYPKNIKTYGASVSTVLGDTSVSGEISTRRNTPLHVPGDLVVTTDLTADNDKNPAYAVGNTFHANLNGITVFNKSPAWDAASLVGELAFNRLLSVTRNSAAQNVTHTRDALAVRFVFQPEYFQVMPGVDLQVPIAVGYGIYGRSAVFQASPEHGGDISIGFNFDYRKTWKAGVQFTHYYGPEGPAPSLDPSKATSGSYKQNYADRDFISASIQRTF